MLCRLGGGGGFSGGGFSGGGFSSGGSAIVQKHIYGMIRLANNNYFLLNIK